MVAPDQYSPDRSLMGKMRRRLVRLAERRPATVRLERPMVSFAFDDVPATALTNAAKMLEARGLRGTYFISAGLAGYESRMGRYADREQLLGAAAAGHELACHTYSHLDCGSANEAAILADVERNHAAMIQWGVPTAANFAYPYGDVSLPAKRVLAKRFGLSRALHRGLIETGTDLNQAPAVGVEGPAGGIYARRWLEYAVSRRAWVIFYTHDVCERPSPFGCSSWDFRELVDRALTLDCDIVTVAEGARRIGACVPS
jgi:peptidoglycan/xylan/chitin deacetylase (PgdA/CDA1 family)